MSVPLPILKKNIAVIIVGHESGSDLEALLPELIDQSPECGLEIIVIDNASTDHTAEVIKRHRKDITSVVNSENVGFATAVNQGFKASKTSYVLLLNPDARLTSSGIKILHNYLETHPIVAAVAPRLEFPDGRLQPSRGSFPTVLQTIAHLFRFKRLMPDDRKIIQGPMRWLGKIFGQYAPLPKFDQTVDYTTGACVLLRRAALEEAGGMDESFFLYYEEIDLARRLRDAGYKWVFLNSAVAVHTVAASSGKAPLRPFYERYKSMCYYFRKHHNPFQAFVVRQLLYIMVFLRWGSVLINRRFRLDPSVPLETEIAMYRRLTKRRTRIKSKHYIK
jgi:GT2 family glycosyltransferase